MRPVTVMAKPTFNPYVCVNCGVGGPPRLWFIEFGINLDLYFNPVNEGNVYYCNECWEDLARQVAKNIQIFLHDTMPWTGNGFIRPTYQKKEELIESRIYDYPIATIDPITTRHDQESDRDAPRSESADSTSESSSVTGEDSDVLEFRDFFSGSGNSTT